MTKCVDVRPLAAVAVGVMLMLATATPARAEGFLSPLIGYNFGGDAACPQIDGCSDKRLNAGVSAGVMSGLFGFEEEFAYAKDFFGKAPNLDSSVLTLMSNVLVAPKIGPVRPYVTAGVGLIKTKVDFTTSSIFSSSNNNFGFDLGGGLMVSVAPHVGVRGDIRYFHAFQNIDTLGFSITNEKINFSRAAAALVFTF